MVSRMVLFLICECVVVCLASLLCAIVLYLVVCLVVQFVIVVSNCSCTCSCLEVGVYVIYPGIDDKYTYEATFGTMTLSEGSSVAIEYPTWLMTQSLHWPLSFDGR